MKTFFYGFLTAYALLAFGYCYKHWPEIKARLVAYHILKG